MPQRHRELTHRLPPVEISASRAVHRQPLRPSPSLGRPCAASETLPVCGDANGLLTLPTFLRREPETPSIRLYSFATIIRPPRRRSECTLPRGHFGHRFAVEPVLGKLSKVLPVSRAVTALRALCA